MLNNNFLFSSQFLEYLKSEMIKDEDLFSGFVETIKSINRKIKETNDFSDNDVTNVLSYLQFAHSNQLLIYNKRKAKYTYLYDRFPLKKKVSCIYIVPPNESIDSTIRGFYPAFDIIHLLKKENLGWGILTNGSKWRLYSVLSPLPYENFLEVDFATEDEKSFRVFWQLFSLNLFIPDEYNVTQLEKYVEESEKEAKVIEDHIKKNIDEVLENICFGFLSYVGKDKQPLSEEEKTEYFDNAVYLLFRILFILYAESRKLLPLEKEEYQPISLQTLMQKACDWQKTGIESPNSTELWDSFRELTIYIEYGDSSLEIPEYDGGLFDNRSRPFLTDPKNKLTNTYFSKILYRLGYFIKRKNEIKIEYKDLSVRSIGSLYEGILEYQLFIAEKDLVIRGKKIIPKTSAGNIKKTDREIPKGHVYFAQDAFERHDTGSYYTPEDVVNYMVQNSVRLGLEERWIDFSLKVKEYEKELNRSVNESTKTGILKKFAKELEEFINSKILSYKVLDPAMGSGHFLVNSLNAITHFILEVFEVKVSISKSPIKHDKEIQEINWENFESEDLDMDLNPVNWRRKVVERCIFGIDINPLATELAKLSLWIASASKGKPLTFLDHHLKFGDSIKGVGLKDIITYPNSNTADQQNMWDHVDKEKIVRIESKLEHLLSIDSDKIDNVYSKKDEYDEIETEPLLMNLKDIASLWLLINSEYRKKGQIPFDLPDQKRYYDLLDNASQFSNRDKWEEYVGYDLIDKVLDFDLENSLFHWELEFPEIINNYFECIIGNPPYVDVKIDDYCGVPIKSLKSNNMYAYIPERAFQHLKKESYLSFITKMVIVSSKRMAAIQSLFSNESWYLFNIDSTSHPGMLFKSVQTTINIFVVKKNNQKQLFTTNYTRFYKDDRKSLFKDIQYHRLNNKALILDYTIPKISTNIEEEILSILNENSSAFGDFINKDNQGDKIYYRRAGSPYYRLAFDEPQYLEINGVKHISDSIRSVNIVDGLSKYIFLPISYSSLYYWYWTVYSDCFNFDPKDLYRFPLKLDELKSIEDDLKSLYIKIKDDLLKNSEEVVYNKANGITKYNLLRPRKSKIIFDQVDLLVGQNIGLQDHHINFLINYDSRFRID